MKKSYTLSTSNTLKAIYTEIDNIEYPNCSLFVGAYDDRDELLDSDNYLDVYDTQEEFDCNFIDWFKDALNKGAVKIEFGENNIGETVDMLYLSEGLSLDGIINYIIDKYTDYLMD